MNTPEELARFKEDVRQRTRLVLEKVPLDQLDWAPAPQTLTSDRWSATCVSASRDLSMSCSTGIGDTRSDAAAHRSSRR
jgi:hypothetical protein